MTNKEQPTDAGEQPAPIHQSMALHIAEALLKCSSDHNGETCLKASAIIVEQHARIAELHAENERLRAQLAAQVRTPLSENGVCALAEKASYSHDDPYRAHFVSGLRHGERAHGITELETLQPDLPTRDGSARLNACREAFARYTNHVANSEGIDFLSPAWGFDKALPPDLKAELAEMLKVRDVIDAADSAKATAHGPQT